MLEIPTPQTSFPVEACRQQFPALDRVANGFPAAFFDGPGGTQCPQSVIDAVAHYLAFTNANHHGLFATATESDQLLEEAHQTLSHFLNANDPCEVSFGQNMTSLTMALSRALSKTWKPGEEIIVTLLDHDANVSPWVLAAHDAGVKVHYLRFHPEDCTLDLEDFQQKLSSKTRLVALGCASNSVGTLNPVKAMTQMAQAAGAKVFLDAVHYAPHILPDVQDLGCDFLACSAYKFFGPHVGILWGRRTLLEELAAYKLRPAPNSLPGKWMTGTQSHEGIAGAKAAVDYLANLGRSLAPQASVQAMSCRAALTSAYQAIYQYEQQLCTQLLEGLLAIQSLKIYGITNPQQQASRLATVSFTHAKLTSEQLAKKLGEQGLFAWHGNYYALNLTEQLGLEPHGMLRIGLVHYNTSVEVSRLLQALEQLS